MKQLVAAERSLRASLRERPGDARVHYLLGKLDFHCGQFNDAETACKVALDGSTDPLLRIRTLLLLLRSVIARGDLKAARAMTMDYPISVPAGVEITGADARRVIDLAATLSELRVPELAYELLAAITGRDDPALTLTLGKMALAAGLPDHAQRHFRNYIEQGGSSPLASLGLARIAMLAGKPGRARMLRRKAARDFPYFVDTACGPAAQRVLIVNDLPLPRFASERDAYNHSQVIRSYARKYSGRDWAFDVIMAGGLSTDTLEQLELRDTHIVLNNIGDAGLLAENGYAGTVVAIAARARAKLLNRPDAVLETSRVANYRRYATTGDFIFPRTEEFSPGASEPLSHFRQILARFGLPVIIRGGTEHNGANVFLCASPQELARALARFPAKRFHAIAYHDSRVDDRTWRRFEMVCIGGAAIPSAVQQSDQWNFALRRPPPSGTVPADLRELQNRYRRDPVSVIGAHSWQHLQAIGRTTCLDICGIRFGFARGGKMVVFKISANASGDARLIRRPLEALLASA
jgi:hypothetical protein